LRFSGGLVDFQLPGHNVHAIIKDYSGTAVFVGWSGAYGTLYRVSGSFSGTDAATHQHVTGSVSTLVAIQSHSGRGGGNIYTALNGSITIK
jgi:predicted heme/steroid binding protein